MLNWYLDPSSDNVVISVPSGEIIAMFDAPDRNILYNTLQELQLEPIGRFISFAGSDKEFQRINVEFFQCKNNPEIKFSINEFYKIIKSLNDRINPHTIQDPCSFREHYSVLGFLNYPKSVETKEVKKDPEENLTFSKNSRIFCIIRDSDTKEK